jgi:PAS domain S-box-containing protein
MTEHLGNRANARVHHDEKRRSEALTELDRGTDEPGAAIPRRAAEAALRRPNRHTTGILESISEEQRARRELEAIDAELKLTLETTDTGLTHCSRDLRYISANSAYAKLTGVPVEEIVGRPIVEVMGVRAFARIRPYIERVLRGERVTYEAEIPWANAAPSWNRVVCAPAAEAGGAAAGWVASITDITEQKRAEQNLLGQRHILERVATGAPLDETLDELMLFVESQESGLRSGLLIVTEDDGHFRRGSGPHLPEAYHRALDGVPITPPYFASCGEAAHRCTPVKIPDIAAETPYAPEWRQLMLQCGLRAVRSTPVHGSDGRVLASLATYYDHPRDPDPANPQLLDIATQFAAIALERDRADKALAAELEATKDLQSISTELMRDQGVEALYDKLVEAAAVIMRSEFASMQVLHPERNGGRLRLVASRGFDLRSAEFWQWIGAHRESTCGMMLRSGRQVIVPDFLECASMAGSAELAAYRESGVRAAQTTPLVSRSGRLLGAISTHWTKPHAPPASDLRRLDVLARQAADLIERGEAERALRRSRETLTAAMAASDTGTFRWDPHTGEFIEFDKNLNRLFGFAPDEQVRTTEDFIARVHPDDLPALTAAIEACRGGADFAMEFRVVLPDGSVRWLFDRARMERDGAGYPLCLVGACTDVTKRREAEDRLRGSEQQFRSLADAIPALAWMAEPDGGISWFNRGWYDYTGSTPEEMTGWGWQAVHDPRVLPEVLARWHASLESGTPFEMVFPIRGADGVFRPFLTRVAPMRDGAGRIVRWFGTNTDISGQREIQDTLARLTETLERELAARSRALEAEMAERQKVEAALQQAQRLEAIGQLTGGVAHDFNNLLTVVLGQTEAIAMAADGNDRIRNMATAAQRAAERGAQLTDQLLTFAGRQQLRPVTVAVDGLIRGIGDLVRRTIGETITVDLAVPAGLWASRLDRAQFESAILNLAINARDAMPDGGSLRIDACNALVAGGEARRLDLRPGEYALVRVADTGTGMSPEVARRAFEPFYTTKDIGKGTGLGLSQIYGFARQSGGTAVLDSVLGEGTTVSLYLPRAEAAVDEAADAAGVAAPRAKGGTTVLLVEDQADVREVTAMALEELGYRVLTASDGVQARRMLESDQPIDLLFTDVVMPNGVGGIELAEEARRLRQDLRIVIVSGYLRDGNPNAAAMPGVVFLEKPFRQAEMAETIARALRAEVASRKMA